ncbi:MAG: RNA-binding protein [Parcubacteria group bacterium CG08_land_8_20_14_0_20_48_21]|nr:MAG: RNA-binding protein [Parcubacteria group bacterium CG2_30_48_51]PIS33180.1 MAG: RNA-binding protein [Parcubacteria group bacterium CG08_land_8_20_14_0_20_48_21]PIW79423.1 MAG: RNA-binding protein [Parcubacteria group bacterium CG_4_8_14_3_um_filter_48_16]PIY77684.1 MAG: RNA-binding protein [Parcubacteria group bacterium CG_4_10_14_0_8_um_filter_48_154]PIZ77460.1 MAG: RNA-binding protein [bacterium CG_4_10_14_0_2_um_filter_48_144]PJC40027.1 MAG: RNA-binding protein [Parcubacteria group 
MAERYEDQDFIEYVVKSIVSTPDAVRTERVVDEMGVLITLHIDQKDMGYVIGRQGQTARALRTLLKIVGAKNNARINLKIHEPEGGRGFRGDNHGESRPIQEKKELDDIDISAIDDLKI